MSKPKIYLAGPEVFLKDPIAVGEKLKKICAEYGLEGRFPMDAQLDLTGKRDSEVGLAIYEADIGLLRSCDAVVANMAPFRGPSMDVGTAFEMGAAIGLGLPVFGYSDNCWTYREKVAEHFGHNTITKDKEGKYWAPDTMQVEDSGFIDNLMMIGSVNNEVKLTFEDAIQVAAKYFKEIGEA